MNVHHHTRGLGLTGESRRDQLVQELRSQGIRDEKVLGVIRKVPRHEFIGQAMQGKAYQNSALPIGSSQTISQPYIVALMTQTGCAGGVPNRVLEIGTGSGYQTAVLAELVPSVFSVERIRALSQSARERLTRLGYRNVIFGYSDGMKGWQQYAPYDAIVVTAAAEAIPPALEKQLAPGGRMVIPVGPPGAQQLKLVRRGAVSCTTQTLAAVSFVPLLEGKT